MGLLGFTKMELWYVLFVFVNEEMTCKCLQLIIKQDGAISPNGIKMLPYVHQPIAISQFPYDLWYRTPLDWAQRGGNVKYRTVHKRGGHFCSLDAPDLLLDDIWRFFGKSELSGTTVFRSRNGRIVQSSKIKDEL
jgi:hypothetical protein